MDAETVLGMGKYAVHVWGAYGLCFVVFAGLLTSAVVKLHKLGKDVKK